MHQPPISESPRIFLLGPQAAGKTTVRSQIEAWWRRRGVTLATLGIEEAQRALCPPDRESSAYRYDEHGALILLDRERLIQEALELLATQCREAARQGGFIAEIAHRRLDSVVEALGADLLAGALSLFLTAPLAVRLERNLLRKSYRIPEEVVRTYPESPTIDEINRFRDAGSSLHILDTGVASERTHAEIERMLAKHVDGCGAGAARDSSTISANPEAT